MVLVRVEPDGQPIGRNVQHVASDVLEFVDMVGDLVVGDEEEAVVLLLQPHPVFERATVVTEVQ